jgi:hypothetical protein
VGSGLSLVPWSLAGLALGACCRTARTAAVVGGLFGFALAFTFMAAGYEGGAPLATRLAPFVLLGVIGALCGCVLALGGHLVRRAAGRAPASPRERRADRVIPVVMLDRR